MLAPSLISIIVCLPVISSVLYVVHEVSTPLSRMLGVFESLARMAKLFVIFPPLEIFKFPAIVSLSLIFSAELFPLILIVLCDVGKLYRFIAAVLTVAPFLILRVAVPVLLNVI